MQKITGLAQSDPVAPGSPQSWGISRHYSISCQGRNKHIKSQGEPTLSRSICNRAGTFEVIFGNKSWRKLTYISKHWKVYRSVPYFRSSKLIREILLAYHRGREHGREGGGGQDNIYVGGDGGDNLHVKIPWGGGGSDEFLKCRLQKSEYLGRSRESGWDISCSSKIKVIFASNQMKHKIWSHWRVACVKPGR